MAVMKGVHTVSYEAGGTIGQYEPVKLGTSSNTVVVPTATTDWVDGVAMIDATSGKPVSVAKTPGEVVLMRVGSGGVIKGDLCGLDSTDKTEIATITENGGGSTLKQVVVRAEETGIENQLISCTLVLSRTIIT
jgi:hypothetical protein